MLLKLSDHRLGHEFLGLKIDMETEIANPLSGRRTNRGNFCAADFARVIVKFVEYFEKCVHPVWTGKHNPVVLVRVLHELGEFAQISRRLDPNRRQFKNVGAERAKLSGECARLFPRPRHHDPLSGKRPALVPIQIFSQCHDVAENGHGRRFKFSFGYSLGNIFERAGQCLLAPRCRPTNQRDRKITPDAVRHHFSGNRLNSLDAHQHHLRATELR